MKHQLAGRFLDLGEAVHVLEDYFGLLAELTDGQKTVRTETALRVLRLEPSLEVVAEEEIKRGKRPDLPAQGLTSSE